MIETQYDYSDHDASWYAEQCRNVWDGSRQRASFRCTRGTYKTREECQRAVHQNKAEWGPWS